MRNFPSISAIIVATLKARDAIGCHRRFLLDWFGIGQDYYWAEYLKQRGFK